MDYQISQSLDDKAFDFWTTAGSDPLLDALLPLLGLLVLAAAPGVLALRAAATLGFLFFVTSFETPAE